MGLGLACLNWPRQGAAKSSAPMAAIAFLFFDSFTDDPESRARLSEHNTARFRQDKTLGPTRAPANLHYTVASRGEISLTTINEGQMGSVTDLPVMRP